MGEAIARQRSSDEEAKKETVIFASHDPMKKKRFVLLVLCALSTASVFAGEPDSYLCIAQSASGFTFDQAQNRWYSTAFKAESKYIMAGPNDKERGWGYSDRTVRGLGWIAPIRCRMDFMRRASYGAATIPFFRPRFSG